MDKKAKQSIRAMAAFVVLCCGCCGLLYGFAMRRMPFSDARASLDRRLQRDFGMKLPESAKVPQGYWVVARDPENAWEADMPPAEIAPWIDQLKATSATRRHEVSVEEDASHVHPLYGAPSWWNSPPAPDAEGFRVFGYGVIWSAQSGKAFIYWGED